jgi:serine/threonine-protein kinase
VVAVPAWVDELRRRAGRLLGGRRRPASPGAREALRRSRRATSIALASVAIGVVAVGAGLFLRSRRPPPPAAPSIVVLPFANVDGGPDQDYFADGITEEIQGALAQVRGLRVIGRTSSFALKGKGLSPQALGRKLGVTTVLEGSVRRAGSRLRVTAQIVDARDGYPIWSQAFDRAAGDVLAVQDEIGQAVAEALALKLLPAKSGDGRARAVDPEAYNQYLLARKFLAPSSLDGFVRAAAASESALAIAPSFAPAWTTLAEAYAGMADYIEDPVEMGADLRKAVEASARAIALDPRLAEAYAVRAQLLAQISWNWEGAADDYDRALALAPGNADILRKKSAWFLAPQGRLPEAIDAARRATELDPLRVSGWVTLGHLQVGNGQGDDGERSLRRALEIDPQSDYARNASAVRNLLAGRYEAALAEAGQCEDGMWKLRGIALAEHSRGNEAAARAALRELEARYASPSPYQIAEVHAWLGDREQALAWLEKAWAARDGGLLILQWDPLLRSLRGDPRLAAIQRRMNLPPN